jgi:hypothetical protein
MPPAAARPRPASRWLARCSQFCAPAFAPNAPSQITVTASGAENLGYTFPSGWGDCNATTVVEESDFRTNWAWDLIKLKANTTTKVTFACAFVNASMVPDNISFIGFTAAAGARPRIVRAGGGHTAGC